MKNVKKEICGLLMALLMASPVYAANVDVTSDIGSSTTWTSNNVYNLTTQIYVVSGATLTIEPGTVIASTPTTNGGGSLAVTKGAKIYVNGTKENPVIMTSTADVATWDVDITHPTGKDPRTGTWRAAANEWGNLTLMGDAIIGYSYDGQSAFPNVASEADMEGLIASGPGDTKVKYGGLNDNDDSGSIHYLSIRYGGRVATINRELNGLSLGAIGRATDISHVEIMNNVDDGVEIWGGTVNLKNLSVWNVGDDSFDVDQGWRGKAQFALLVQGYSVDAAQGSGIGDNCFETDGAEDSDAQPRTTATVYNATVIGQPISGDNGTEWRDNARVQYRNSVFVDIGEKLVKNKGADGDGASGYGFNGTHTFDSIWTTASSVTPVLNLNGAAPSALYQSQTSGNLAEIKDSVFFKRNSATLLGDAPVDLLTGYDNVSVTAPDYTAAPVKSLSRGAAVLLQGETLTMLPVTNIDPRANNEAITSVASAPLDGFFTPAPYRGAFSKDTNWLCGWSASSALKMPGEVNRMTTCTGLPTDPTETIGLTATTFFQTVVAVNYVVEESNDGTNWVAIASVIGDGTMMSITDVAPFDAAKLYRVLPL